MFWLRSGYVLAMSWLCPGYVLAMFWQIMTIWPCPSLVPVFAQLSCWRPSEQRGNLSETVAGFRLCMMKEIQLSNRSVRPQYPTRFQRLDFHGVRFSISVKMKNLVRIDSVSTKSQWKTYVWISDRGLSQHFMVEHKMYSTLAAELSKDWSKLVPSNFWQYFCEY